MDVLDDLVWREVAALIRNPEPTLDQLAVELHSRVQALACFQIEEIEIDKALADKPHERERVIGMARQGLISAREVERELTDLEEEVRALEQRRQALLQHRRETESLQRQLAHAGQVLERLRETVDQADSPARRTVIEALVERIDVRGTGERRDRVLDVTITYHIGVVSHCSAKATPYWGAERQPSLA